MNIEFIKIDFVAFERIWNSAHYDNHLVSWKNTLENTSEEEWWPVFEKWKSVMNEVLIDGTPSGYIFLSPKSDGSAHLGYGIYRP